MQMQQDRLEKTVITPGNGEQAATGRKAFVHYTGFFPDGRVFDSSVQRGQPFSFVVGAGQVIKGWDLVVASMKVGEKCRTVCPPQFAYGAQGVGPIPPNATLIFDIELLALQ